MTATPPNLPAKSLLRPTLRARRNAFSNSERDQFSARICGHLTNYLLALDGSISTIALYQAQKCEVDLSALMELNFDFVVPRRVENGWVNAEEANVFERVHGAQVLAPYQIDIFLVPVVGCDAQGNRLGQGGGWYDRVLARAPHAAKIGIAFGCQIVENVPHEKHDLQMDGVITENGWCKALLHELKS